MAAGGNYSGDRSTFPVALQAYAMLGVFAVIGVSVMLIWRHRWPLVVSILATGAALILPTTALPSLIALAALTAARAGWVRWVMVAATYVAVIVALCWDVASDHSYLAGLAGDPAPGSPERVSLLWLTPVVALFTVAPFAAFGMTRHLRVERDAARRGSAAAERNVAVLHREVERERERQELARELHDTLAARLSALSLHAGALELTAGSDDGRAAAAARAVRETAQLSLDDLRHLVRTLRDPTAARTSTGLADLATLIDGAVRNGTDIRAQVFVNDPGSCDPEVAHACYRLVQESISNVLRHAPGAALYLDVRGGPEAGLTVRASNWLTPATAPATAGGGNGLVGMNERVTLVGGAFQAGTTPEGSFAVVAWMPWVRR